MSTPDSDDLGSGKSGTLPAIPLTSPPPLPTPPSPRRLEELDNAPQSQGEEQWSTVSKGALPKTVAKTVAKEFVNDPAAVTAAHATGHAFGALTKFMEPDDGDEDDETQQEEPSGALNVSDFKVSTPFFHVFEDTGKGVWCCVVTSPSGFDSAPVPITATVKRVGKLKPNSPPPTLEPEENTEVILDFKRRQKEERKKAAAEGGKKKKKKKKSPEEPETTSEVTVTEHHDVDKTELSKSIMNDLFAAPVYTAPIESAEVQREVSDKGNVFDAIQRETSRVLPDPPRERPRGVPPPPGLGGFVQPPAAAAAARSVRRAAALLGTTRSHSAGTRSGLGRDHGADAGADVADDAGAAGRAHLPAGRRPRAGAGADARDAATDGDDAAPARGDQGARGGAAGAAGTSGSTRPRLARKRPGTQRRGGAQGEPVQGEGGEEEERGRRAA